MSDNSIWRTLSGATTPSQGGPESNGNEKVLYFTQISKTWDSLSDRLMSFPGQSLVGKSYPSAETQSIFSTAPADWVTKYMVTMVGKMSQ